MFLHQLYVDCSPTWYAYYLFISLCSECADMFTTN